MESQALSYSSAGKVEESIPTLENVLEAKMKLMDTETVVTMANLGCSYSDLRRLDRAVPLLESVAELRKEILG